MLIVISDLHLEECSYGVDRALRVNRNLDPITYQHFLQEVAEDAAANHAKSVDFVLAGDVFELNRSYIWYEDGIKPYVNVRVVTPGSEYEKKILYLLNLIGQEERVAETLEMFRKMQMFFPMPLRLHYLLGNHDRLVNSTPLIRRKARELLGMPLSDELFPHTFTYYSEGKPLAFIRHGQEYDPMNFSANYKSAPLIPAEIPLKEYDAPPVDDFSAIEIIYKLPYLFVAHYGVKPILEDKKLFNLYQRLVEFQDVRPQSALINYIFNSPGFTRRQIWQYLEPIILHGLNTLRKDPFLKSPAMKGSLMKTFLRLNPWRKNIPFRLVQRFSSSVTKRIGRNEKNLPAVKEEVIRQNGDSVRCIISGHTHQPQVSLMDATDGVERYYFNSGTWRNVVPVSPNQVSFGRIKTFAKVIIYGAEESPLGGEKSSSWSFDFSAGFNQQFME